MPSQSDIVEQRDDLNIRKISSTQQNTIQDLKPPTPNSHTTPPPPPSATTPGSASSQPPLPSSSTAGFFQTPPHIPNQFQDDIALQRALSLLLPPTTLQALTPSLTSFATKVLTPQIQSWILDAERHPPYVKHFDTWGQRRDDLITSTGWQQLQALGIAEGMVAIGYENRDGEYSRVHQFGKYALWAGSSAWVNCPSLMVDGVASLLRKHLSDPKLPQDQRLVLRSAYDRLTSRDPEFAWTTGQWMTERQGGSDVSMTETLATYSPSSVQSPPTSTSTDGLPLGPYRLTGFKWFSSATDANMMVLLARTPKGVSLFFAPMRVTVPSPSLGHPTTTLNGIQIQRLKNKLGTRALPTAELVLTDTRAWLIGEAGKGTKEIATVLNIARIHNGVTAIGFWGRGLAIVRAFTRVRVIKRRPLWERSAYMRTVARMHVTYRADVLFNFFVVALLGVVEQPQIAALTGSTTTSGLGRVPGLDGVPMAEHLLRLFTPALKGHCSKTAIAGLQECMECMGGVGYLENEDMQYNIARLYRDANVLPIWEGTTDMMADDSVVRVLYGKGREEVLKALETWIDRVISKVDERKVFEAQIGCMREWWVGLKKVLGEAERDEAEFKARAIMERLVEILQGLLLLVDAVNDGDEVARLVVHAWFDEKEQGAKVRTDRDWKDQVAVDLKIVFGVDGPAAVRPRL